MRFIAILCSLFLALMMLAQPARAAGKVALVIGNANYLAASSLNNPLNDTRLVADALRKNSFEVIPVVNANLVQFRAALREFRKKASGADIAMVYFAGHGIEANGSNWLIPIDARLESDFDLSDEAVDLERVLEALAGSKVRVVVLDACRNNPFGRSWSRSKRAVTRGLAPIEIDDVLVIYAAAPGQVANDGEGGNSPFAKSLAARLVQPGLPLQLLGGAVRDDVLAATGSNQRPFVSASMTGTPIYLAPGVSPPVASAELVTERTPTSTVMRSDGARLIQECDRLAGPDIKAEEALPALAIPACRKAVEASPGNWRMMAQLGQVHILAADYAEGRKWLEQASAKGEATAIVELGDLYLDGRGVKQNYAKALKFYEEAAETGNANAMQKLAYAYYSGQGVPKDYVKARKWAEEGAAKGNVESMGSLGSVYGRGLGVVKDHAMARTWYERAASNNSGMAMNELGHIYAFGDPGVTQSYAEARKWYERAADLGIADSMYRLGNCPSSEHMAQLAVYISGVLASSGG